MDNFVVSARKYRPVTFDSVVGQGSITSTLKNSIKNNLLAQAFLFTGPRGVGKTTCARIFAKTINCEMLGENMEPCDKCESCVSFNQQNSFNIHELDAASNNSVEDIRRLVEQVRIPPQVGKYKVYIIDEVHMLSAAAFNAFLKTLEEPPSYAKFILATTEKHKIIPTILSRCQIYDFNRITIKDTVGYLEYVAKSENVEIEEAALLVIAQKADGAMRDALSIFDQLISFTGKNITYQATIDNLNVLDVEYYFTMVELFVKGNIPEALTVYNSVISKGFDGLHFINGLASHLRNLLVSKDVKTVELLETSSSIRQQYIDQTEYCSLKFLIIALEYCSTVDVNYKMTSDKRLLVELNLLRMCKIENEYTENAMAKYPALRDGVFEALPSQNTIEPPKKTVEVKYNEKEETIVSNANYTEDSKIEETKVESIVVDNSSMENSEPKIKEETKDAVKEETNDIVEEVKPSVAENITKPIKKRSKVSGLSIKAGIKNIAKKEEINYAEELGNQFDTVTEEIKIDDLERVINAYREIISKEKPAFSSAIEFENIDLRQNNEIHLRLANDAMDDVELKYNLLAFLKKELHNKQISISSEIREIKFEKKESSREIYNNMIEKNPKLDDLRKQLDLDFGA